MKKTKKRRYNTRRIHLTTSYSTLEVAELYGLHKGSVLNWIKQGLKIIDQHKPYLIRGSDLFDFLNKRQKLRKVICQSNELYCFKCRSPRRPINKSVQITKRNEHRLKVVGRCAICNTKMFRDGALGKLDEIRKIFSIELQSQEHIVDCELPSVNSDINKEVTVEQVQS